MAYQADKNRYQEMNYKRCGRSGLKLPAVSLGLWHNFGSYDSYENSRKMCETAFDLGITHFDLANNYGPEYGSAERNFGTILKALYVGISNYDGVQLKKAEQLLTEMHCPFIINQNKYSIFDRTIEKNGLKETAPKLGLGIIAFSPLAQGLLTDKYLHGIPQGSRIQKNSPYLTAASLTPEMLQKISALNDMAHERGESLAQMALNWILKDDALTSVLIGASSPAQIIENTTKIRRHAFTEEELQKIDRIVF